MVHRISVVLVSSVVLVGFAVSTGVAQSGVFRSAPLSSVGSRPTALEVADVDGDGNLDVVTTTTGGSNNVVTIAIGFGDATFVEFRQAEVDVNGLPGELELADFDGDGIGDVAAVNTNEAVLVMLRGGGTRQDVFADPGPEIAVGGAPVDVTSADLDGDGNRDIVTANEETEGSEGTVSVLLGAGDLTFSRVDHDSGTDGVQDLVAELGTSTVVIADINKDLILDILALNRISETISVFLGDGDGTFTDQSVQSVPGVQHFALADVDGDGNLDLAGARTNTDRIEVRPGNGDGTFGNVETYRVGSAPIRVAIHDVTGDGELDIIAANSRSQDASVLAGDGAGSFASARTYVADAEPRRLGFGDFDNDGREDVAVVSEGGLGATVAILRGREEGTFLAAEDVRVDGAPTDLGVADVDGNGFADVVGVSEGGDVFVFPSSGADGLGSRVNVPVSSDSLRGLALADVDGDHRIDVVVSDINNGELALLRGQPDGTLEVTSRFTVGPVPAPVVTGDFNDDGRIDIATALVDESQVAVLMQRAGSGSQPTFGTVQLSPITLTGMRSAPIELKVIDANCDGRDDLVAANNAINTVAVLVSAGDGTFTVSNELGPGVVGELPDSLVVADFDSDGRDDFAMSNARVTGNAPSIRFFFGRCDGTFETAREKGFGDPNNPNIQAGLLVTAITARDFSGDQIIDIGAVNQTSNVARSFLLLGDDGVANGFFDFRKSDTVSRMPEAIGAGDFDADGRYDLVVGNTDASSNNLTILLNCSRDPGCDIFNQNPSGVAANRGDANDDGILSAADLAALALEVIDGDGSDVEEVERGAFAGVAGADSNGDGRVDDQDARAIARRLFSGVAG